MQKLIIQTDYNGLFKIGLKPLVFLLKIMLRGSIYLVIIHTEFIRVYLNKEYK